MREMRCARCVAPPSASLVLGRGARILRRLTLRSGVLWTLSLKLRGLGPIYDSRRCTTSARFLWLILLLAGKRKSSRVASIDLNLQHDSPYASAARHAVRVRPCKGARQR